MPPAESPLDGKQDEKKRREKMKEDFLNFLANATQNWEPNQTIKRMSVFGEEVSCAAWEGRFFITGTDIVKVVSIRYKLDAVELPERKKFEEGVFSDLRNLKPGLHAVLERPHSKFLDFLYLNNCVRTHKKQKVFFWECVPHEKLYQESLKRDEKRGSDPMKQSMSVLQKLTTGKLGKEDIIRIKSFLNEKLKNLEQEQDEDDESDDDRFRVEEKNVMKREIEVQQTQSKRISIDNCETTMTQTNSTTFTQRQTLPSIKYLLQGLVQQPQHHFDLPLGGNNLRNFVPSQQTVRQKKSISRWNYDPAQRNIPPLPPPASDYSDRVVLPAISDLKWDRGK